MAFIVVYDACVLHPAPLRDLLLRLGATELVQAKYSEHILDEVIRSLEKRPQIDAAKLPRLRRAMSLAIADCIVTGHENLIEALNLPDPDDRHVLAAAIVARAQVIVTANVKDFPSSALGHYGIRAQTPEAFVGQLVSASGPVVARVIVEQAGDLKRKPLQPVQVLDALEKLGLGAAVEALRPLVAAAAGDERRAAPC